MDPQYLVQDSIDSPDHEGKAKYLAKHVIENDPAKNIELIRSIYKEKSLYHREYTPSNNKSDDIKNAWKRVSVSTNIPVEECKNRWYTLRSTFRRLKYKLKENNGVGRPPGRPPLISQDPDFESKSACWWNKYSSELSFLLPHITKYGHTGINSKNYNKLKERAKLQLKRPQNNINLNNTSMHIPVNKSPPTSQEPTVYKPIAIGPLENHYRKRIPAHLASHPLYRRAKGPDISVKMFPVPKMQPVFLAPVNQPLPPHFIPIMRAPGPPGQLIRLAAPYGQLMRQTAPTGQFLRPAGSSEQTMPPHVPNQSNPVRYAPAMPPALILAPGKTQPSTPGGMRPPGLNVGVLTDVNAVPRVTFNLKMTDSDLMPPPLYRITDFANSKPNYVSERNEEALDLTKKISLT